MSKIIKNLLLVALGAAMTLVISPVFKHLNITQAPVSDTRRIFNELRSLNPNNNKDILIIPKDNLQDFGDSIAIPILEIEKAVINRYAIDIED